MVRSLRSREVKDAAAKASTSPPVTDDVDAVDAVAVQAGPAVAGPTPLEAKPEEPQGEEVLVGHTAMDLVALGQRADKEQCAAEEEKLPCLSRCRVRLAHCCRSCCESLAACFSRRLDAWENWLAAREQASFRSSFEHELRRLYAGQLPAPGLLDLWGPSVRTMEKCHTLSFSEKEVLLAFTEAQLKRGPDLLKVEQLLPVSVETFRYDLHGRHLQTVTTSADIVAYCAYGDQWSFEGDLALLKLKAPVEITAAALISEKNFEEVRALDEVVMVGCPDSSEVPLPTTGHVASLSEVRAGIGLMLSQVFGNPGSSGSAVYRFSPERNQYEVIALHSLTDGRGSLTSLGRGNFLRLAVQAPEIHKFLRSHQLLHLVQPPEEAQGTKSAPPKKAAKTAKTASTGTKTATKAKKKATS